MVSIFWLFPSFYLKQLFWWNDWKTSQVNTIHFARICSRSPLHKCWSLYDYRLLALLQCFYSDMVGAYQIANLASAHWSPMMQVNQQCLIPAPNAILYWLCSKLWYKRALNRFSLCTPCHPFCFFPLHENMSLSLWCLHSNHRKKSWAQCKYNSSSDIAPVH